MATSRHTMRAVRLHAPGDLERLIVEEVEIPQVKLGESLVRVHAAALTRDELEWPLDRLPAIPSYELSGVVVAAGPDVADVSTGDAVYALTGFDRDGVAAEYAVVPASILAPKPRTLGHVESAALPLAGLSAWQGLFVHGRLQARQRVLIHGAAGGVGHLATQLARWCGAYVIGTTSGAGVEIARSFGAHEVIDRSETMFEDAVKPVDLVFDTVGGDVLSRSVAALRVRPAGWCRSLRSLPPASRRRSRPYISSWSRNASSSSSSPVLPTKERCDPRSIRCSRSRMLARRSSVSWPRESAARSCWR